MRIISPKIEILTPIDGKQVLQHIERCGRVCYKSEARITEDSAKAFVQRIMDSGHESVLEHASFTVKFTVDRGVSHEIVRHRLASYSQESTRYCNYSKDRFGNEITVIRPCGLEESSDAYRQWKQACEAAEKAYFAILEAGAPPELARDVLPTSLKTEIVMTANLREWRHFLKLRTDVRAHPQMREVALPLNEKLRRLIPVIFDNIGSHSPSES